MKISDLTTSTESKATVNTSMTKVTPTDTTNTSIEHLKNELFSAMMENNVQRIRNFYDKTKEMEGRDEIINAKDDDKNTSLHLTAEKCHVDVVKFLVEKCADLNAARKDGATPLHISASKGYVDVIKFLVEKGANLNAPNKNGANPLYIAAENDNMSNIYMEILEQS